MRTSASLFVAAVATVLAVAGAAPAAAQFREPPLERSEDSDTIDIAVTPDGREWWITDTDGEVSVAPLGDVQVRCDPPDFDGYTVGIDRTSTGEGYWQVSSLGEVYTCGDAAHHGEVDFELASPVADIAATPDGGGYFLVAQDGGVFTFGNAVYQGSAAVYDLAAPTVGIATSSDFDGYWLMATDGGVFTFGTATFHGSAGDVDLVSPTVDITTNDAGNGYALVAEDGGIFTYGGVAFRGSCYTNDSCDRDEPFVGIDFAWTNNGYQIVDNAAEVSTFGIES